MLTVTGIDCFYGDVQVLRGMSLNAKAGEILCLLGRNGAGKTTTLKAIMGIVPARSGSISLGEESINTLPAHEVPKRGIGYVPQGRRLFAEMTVAENIEVGLLTRGKGEETRERVLSLFPRLRDRYRQRAETLSGGEQQMLAMARALSIEPDVLLLDEPTEGLQPSMISLIRDVVIGLKEQNVATILVEQRIDAVLSIADRVVFIENGERRDEALTADLKDNLDLIHKYVLWQESQP